MTGFWNFGRWTKRNQVYTSLFKIWKWRESKRMLLPAHLTTCWTKYRMTEMKALTTFQFQASFLTTAWTTPLKSHKTEDGQADQETTTSLLKDQWAKLCRPTLIWTNLSRIQIMKSLNVSPDLNLQSRLLLKRSKTSSGATSIKRLSPRKPGITISKARMLLLLHLRIHWRHKIRLDLQNWRMRCLKKRDTLLLFQM